MQLINYHLILIVYYCLIGSQSVTFLSATNMYALLDGTFIVKSTPEDSPIHQSDPKYSPFY